MRDIQENLDKFLVLLRLLMKPKSKWREDVKETSTEALYDFCDTVKELFNGVETSEDNIIGSIRERCIELSDIAYAEIIARGE